MVSLRTAVTLGFVCSVLVACRIGSALDEPGAKSEAGALCGSNDDCKSNYCRPGGFCGQNGCDRDEDCPAGWTCGTTRGDPIFGLGGGGTYCEPSCSSCPRGTACEGTGSCTRVTPKITVAGGPPRVGAPARLELEIDSRGLAVSEVTWSFADSSGKPLPTPSSGTGTKLDVTFHANGRHTLVVAFSGPDVKQPLSVKVDVFACGEAGSQCSGGQGECCDGECALKRNIAASADEQTRMCVARCPATCAPGHSCRNFDRNADTTLPAGEFCIPDPPVVTVDYSPKNPTIHQAVTFTSTASSPAGLKIIGHGWFIGDSGFQSATGPTYTTKFERSGRFDVTLEVSDDAGQRTKETVTLQSCVPAGESCFGGGLCCAGSSCDGSTCK